MIYSLISEVFAKIGHTWKLDSKYIEPNEADVEEFLDEAAGVLYTRPTGARFESGGLIVEKRPKGHDVWVYVGNYE